MAFALRLPTVLVLGFSLFPLICEAQSFDCGKAQTPIEKAICTSPALIAQDTALADSYRQALAALGNDPAKLADLRLKQRRWLADRNKSCVSSDRARLSKCLTASYQARLAALQALVAEAGPAAAPANQAVPPASPTPAAEPAPQAQEAAQPPAASVPQAAPASVPTPPRPLPPAGPQPRLATDRLPAGQDASTLMTVDVPGHIVIRTQSSTGVALQLVDMISGPGNQMGAPGASDGRVDALLDKGTYKIRTFGAKGAGGDVKLTAQAYLELEQPATTLTAQKPVDAELSDFQQRSYWMDVPGDGLVYLEAVGRSLLDLRLWRDGTDLVDIAPALSVFETKPGLPMTRAALSGKVEPGRYLVTAYGGEKLVWTNSDTTEPFHIRSGTQRSLAAGIAEGVIGPFGSERFEAPADFDTFRLQLAQSAPAGLRAARLSGASPAFQGATIDKTSREPVTTLSLARSDQSALVEVTGYEGQRFQLRGLYFSNHARFDGSVPNLISVDVAGEGGDEIPATALLQRNDPQGKSSVVAADMPQLGPGQAWRHKFNLRGQTSLLFEMTQPGPIAMRSSGPAIRAGISPVLIGNAPRADGRNPSVFDLDAGYYLLTVEPDNNAGGILDLMIGPPGTTIPVQPPSPQRTTISFGLQQADKATSYDVITNVAPGLLTGPRAVSLPADLRSRALTLWQSADDSTQPLNIDVHVPQGGTISTVDIAGNPALFTVDNEQADDKGRVLTLHFKAPPASRALGVYWRPDPAAAAPLERPAREPLTAGQPRFFDLDEGANAFYRLDVPNGGLYRVETSGRLQTSLGIGTSFLPKLGQASDNGDGHNALLQTYLRAGTYQIDVSAQNSSGHLGLSAAPAALATTTTLVPEGSSRGALAGGRGAIVPIEIAKAGRYHLDLYALGDDLTARLEDADGWPLTVPGQLSSLDQDFAPGNYRLVILPREVDTRFVTRLSPVEDAPQLQGHGPHPLAFNQTQNFQWREPQAKDAPRVPDSWTFDLAGEADVSIGLTEGMVGTLTRNDKELVAKFVADPQFSGRLKAGHYRIDLTSLAHDDRLDYSITLNTAALQPGEARFVDLPAELPFNIAEDRVVSLGSFGRQEIKGELKDASGKVIERLAGRADDWNIALSRRLAAGSYTLSLDDAASAGKAGSQPDDASEDQGTDSGGEASGNGGSSKIEVQLALPREAQQPALTFGTSTTVDGASVFAFPLPQGPKGQLTVVAAQSTADLVLSVEKRGADGIWHPQALARGHVPALAWPASDGDTAQWRASTWTLDGGAAAIRIGTQSVARDMREPGDVALEPVSLDIPGLTLNAALVHAPSAGLMQLEGASDFLAGASPDRPLTAVSSGLFAPQSDRLWLVATHDGDLHVTPSETNSAIALTLPAGDQAILPVTASPSGKTRFWRAESAFGQPGLDAGRGMGVADKSAVAVAGPEGLRIWNAGEDEALQMRLTPVDVTTLAPVTADGSYGAAIPGFSAQPVKLPAGVKRLTLDLAPGIAIIAAPSDAQLLNIWSGAASLSRSLATSAGEIWLVNLGDHAASAHVALSLGQAQPLAAGQIRRRFFGTAGSEQVSVDAERGDVLRISGGEATFIGLDGKVGHGDTLPVSGPGELIVDHGAGLVVLWLEHEGKSPWPAPEAQALILPRSVELASSAMAFRLSPAQPTVLDVSTDAPVIIALEQNGRRDLQLFPTGAELHRYLGAGDAVLTVYSTHEGPLSGSMDVTSTPVVPVGEGIGAPVVLAPGTSALFGFEVKTAGNIGVGLRSDPDLAKARLLDAQGKVLGEGLNQLNRLEPGRYLLEARAPADAPTLIVRPAVIGLSPPPAGPPPEIASDYLQRAGLKPAEPK
ncbi:lysozyme inhibitor LprI family protein [Labrys okinawensis]|uniref:lysozyme inhibitor LprI family protein n=1 Tax=Labrys okinawensis TaxID=346911 RepID=UPI0039BC9512